MASRAPIAIQNENLPIFRGIDGKKAGAEAHGPAARAGRQERKALHSSLPFGGFFSRFHRMASRAPIAIQNENLPIFRGIDGKKAGAEAHGPAARAGRQERKALGDLSKARRARPASSTGGKAAAAASGSVGGSSKNLVKPSYLSDEDWMICCEWAKDGIETASFTGNDMQKLLSDKREERIQKKVEKAMGTMELSLDSLYRIDVHLKACMVDPEDKTKLDLDTEFLPPMPYLSPRLGEHDANCVLSDLEFEHETFAICNLDLKLKD